MATLLCEYCERCRELEKIHDEEMDAYIHLIDQQSRMFRIGQSQAGRELDVAILNAKTRRQAAVDALLSHQAAKHSQRIPVTSNARGPVRRRA